MSKGSKTTKPGYFTKPQALGLGLCFAVIAFGVVAMFQTVGGISLTSVGLAGMWVASLVALILVSIPAPEHLRVSQLNGAFWVIRAALIIVLTTPLGLLLASSAFGIGGLLYMVVGPGVGAVLLFAGLGIMAAKTSELGEEGAKSVEAVGRDG